jgi:hypothetical protein
MLEQYATLGEFVNYSPRQQFTFTRSGDFLVAGTYWGKRYKVKKTIQKAFGVGENYIWPRIEGASTGWSAATTNDQETYIETANETSQYIDFVTYVYQLETPNGVQWHPCAPEQVVFAYSYVGVKDYFRPVFVLGADRLCTTGLYQIDAPAYMNVTWTAYPAGMVSLNPSGNQVTVTRIASGDFSLHAHTDRGGTGGTVVTSKNITGLTPLTGTYWGGANGTIAPDYGTTYIQGTPDYTQYHLRMHIDYMQGASYSWQITGGNDYGFVDFQDDEAHWTMGGGARLELQVTATTSSCGSITKNIVIESPYWYSYAAYPNPSSDTFVISQSKLQSEDAKNTPSKKPFEYKLFDKNGKKLKEGKSLTGESVTVDVKDMPADNYFLHITEGKEIIKKQIVIQH